MHACTLQCITKLLLLLIIFSWILYETFYNKKNIHRIHTLSGHVVSCEQWMRILYCFLILVWVGVTFLGYLVLPFKKLQKVQRWLIGILIFSMVFLFLDLFLGYDPTRNVYEQFRRYHNHTLPILFGLLVFTILFFPMPMNKLLSFLHRSGCGILVVLTIIFIYTTYFNSQHYLFENTSWLGIVEAVTLVLAILLFPFICSKCSTVVR